MIASLTAEFVVTAMADKERFFDLVSKKMAGRGTPVYYTKSAQKRSNSDMYTQMRLLKSPNTTTGQIHFH